MTFENKTEEDSEELLEYLMDEAQSLLDQADDMTLDELIEEAYRLGSSFQSNGPGADEVYSFNDVMVDLWEKAFLRPESTWQDIRRFSMSDYVGLMSPISFARYIMARHPMMMLWLDGGGEDFHGFIRFLEQDSLVNILEICKTKKTKFFDYVDKNVDKSFAPTWQRMKDSFAYHQDWTKVIYGNMFETTTYMEFAAIVEKFKAIFKVSKEDCTHPLEEIFEKSDKS